MTTKPQLVVGVFRDRAQAEQAINELLQAGFAHHQIHFAGRGSTAGGILEKIKSLFTGQDVSAGGIYDDLVKMGAPPEDARYYQNEFEAGRSMVTVQGPGDVQKAVNILGRHGGYGANQRFTQSAGYGTGPAQGAGSAQGATPTDGPVAEEKSRDVPVMHEEVYVERRPGSGLPSEQPISEGETYRIPVHEEQVKTEKVPVEHEEVLFGKQPVQETQRVTGAVQREEAHVEHTDDIDVQERGFEQGRDIGQGRYAREGRETRRERDFEQGGNIEDQTTP